MAYTNYISDGKGFVTSLFQEAFSKSVDEILSNWDANSNICAPGAMTNMLAAYKFSQSFKDELPFYSFLCFWLACHDNNSHFWTYKSEYYEEALAYCKDPDMNKYIKSNYDIAKEHHEKDICEGIHESVKNSIVGIEKLKPFYGEGKWNLHDAEVKNMVYDRDKNSLDIYIDTFIPEWSEDNKCHIIPFHFTNLISMEINMDYGNDYVYESRIYMNNNYIYAEFDSAYLKICSRKLSIGKIE